MILYFTALALTALGGQNLLLQKACHPGDTIPPTTSACPDELSAQRVVIGIQTWKDVITLSGPIFFVLFAGSWSDNHGKRRKPLLYLPLCGQVLSDMLCIVNVYFWSWSPSIAALSEVILPAFTGWRTCFIIGMMSYMSDNTSEEYRTLRIGICTAVYFLGSPIGAFVFGLVFKQIGFYGVYLMCVLLNTGALAYLFLFISENAPDSLKPRLKAHIGLMDPTSVVKSFKTVLKPRDGYKRPIILLMIILAGPITHAPLQGEYSVFYFFLRLKFHWNEVDFGFYAGYKSIVIFCGTTLTLGVFSRLLGISDAVIGMMASVTLIMSSLGYALSTVSWEMFLYPIVDFMHGAGLSVVYSTLSKNVETIELGQVNSMLEVSNALFPLVNMPLYNQVYNYTFTNLPGAFFLLSLAYAVLALFIFSVVYGLERKQKL